jgi:hypothetical protein
VSITDDEHLECLEQGPDCAGPVEYRMALSPSGRSFARCEHHFQLRLDEQDRINATYGGVCPPSDFDPLYAGERWDEEY